MRGRDGRGTDRAATEARLPEPEWDPYRVLEVARDAPPAAIRAAYFRLVKRHSPEDDPEGFQAVSEAYRVLSDPNERRRLDAAERLSPELAAALQRAAETIETVPDEAARIAAWVLARSAGSPATQFAAACVLLRAGRPAEALPPLERLEKAPEPRAEHLGALGRAYHLCGRPDDAARVLERSLAVDPTSLQAWLSLTDVEESRGDVTAALRVIDRAIRAAGASGLRCLPLFIREIALLVRLGRWSEMDAVAADVVGRVPAGDADAARHAAREFCELAEASETAGAFDAAKFAVDAARRLLPDPELDAWSARLAPDAAVSRECRTAHLDARVAAWIRSILPPHFGSPVSDPEWDRLCRSIIGSTARRMRVADREWATFRKLYPRGARAAAKSWSDIRKAASAAARESGHASAPGWLRLAASVVLTIAATAALRACVLGTTDPSEVNVWRGGGDPSRYRPRLTQEMLDEISSDASAVLLEKLELMRPEDRVRFFESDSFDLLLRLNPEHRDRILRMARTQPGSVPAEAPPAEAPK